MARRNRQTVVVEQNELDTLFILGLGKTSSDYVSYIYNNPHLAKHPVWTINSGAMVYRHDAVFDMHTLDYILTKHPDDQVKILRRREWLKKHDKPVYMFEKDPQFTTSVEYPLAEVIEKTKTNYFQIGLSYLLALALVRGVKKLFLFGCDFTDANDLKVKEDGRACVEYWLGRIQGTGGVVCIPQASDLMASNGIRSLNMIYGHHAPMIVKVEDGKPVLKGFHELKPEFEKETT